MQAVTCGLCCGKSLERGCPLPTHCSQLLTPRDPSQRFPVEPDMAEDTPSLSQESSGVWSPLTRVIRELDRMKAQGDAVFFPAMVTAEQVRFPPPRCICGA